MDTLTKLDMSIDQTVLALIKVRKEHPDLSAEDRVQRTWTGLVDRFDHEMISVMLARVLDLMASDQMMNID